MEMFDFASMMVSVVPRYEIFSMENIVNAQKVSACTIPTSTYNIIVFVIIISFVFGLPVYNLQWETQRALFFRFVKPTTQSGSTGK